MKNKLSFGELTPPRHRGLFAKIRSLRFMLVLLLATLGVNVAFGALTAHEPGVYEKAATDGGYGIDLTTVGTDKYEVYYFSANSKYGAVCTGVETAQYRLSALDANSEHILLANSGNATGWHETCDWIDAYFPTTGFNKSDYQYTIGDTYGEFFSTTINGGTSGYNKTCFIKPYNQDVITIKVKGYTEFAILAKDYSTSMYLTVTVDDADPVSWKSTTLSRRSVALTTAEHTIVIACAGTKANNIYGFSLKVPAKDPHTVTFDPNGGSCGTGSLKEASAGAGVTLPSATPTDEATQEFKGWAVSSSETDPAKIFAANATYKPTKNETLYAIYGAKVAKFAVNFAAGDGTGSMTALEYEEGAEVTLPACGFTAPAGKEFDAWTSSDVTITAGKFTMPANAVTVTATWKAIDFGTIKTVEGETTTWDLTAITADMAAATLIGWSQNTSNKYYANPAAEAAPAPLFSANPDFLGGLEVGVTDRNADKLRVYYKTSTNGICFNGGAAYIKIPVVAGKVLTITSAQTILSDDVTFTSANGEFTAVVPVGKEYITIKRSSSATYVKKIVLAPAPTCTTPTIAWATEPAGGRVGDADVVAAVTANQAGAAITWESSKPEVATVTNGTIHFVSAGKTTITAKYTGDGVTYCDEEVKVEKEITVTENAFVEPVGAIKLIKDGNINAQDFVTGGSLNAVAKEIAGVNYGKYIALGNTLSAVSGLNATNKIVAYTPTTTSAKVTVVVYNNNSADQTLYASIVSEGDETCTPQSITIPSKSDKLADAVHEFNLSGNQTIYFHVGNTNIWFYQVYVEETGTARPFGRVGYSIDFSKPRFFLTGSNSKEGTFEGLEYKTYNAIKILGQDYVELQTPGYIMFKLEEPAKVKVSVANANAYAINATATYDATTNESMVGTATKEFNLKAGTWYINPNTNTSNRPRISQIEFLAPSSTHSVTFDMQGATSDAIAAQTVFDGEKAVKPADPEKTGFDFAGWVVAATDAAYNWNAAVTADVALKATWTEADPCAGFTVGCTNGPEDFSTEWLENDKKFGETTYALNVRNITGGTAPYKYYWYKTATETHDETTLWTENVDGIYSKVPTNNVAGTSYYYCKVVDANDCVAYSKFVRVTIAEPVDPCANFAVTCTNGQLEPFDEWLNYERYVGATDDIWDFHATAITDGFTAAKYEWYRNTEKSYEGANLVRWNKAEDTEYTNNHSALPYVDEAGTYYYFCKVTSTGGCVAYSKYITYEVKEKAYASSIDLETIAGNSTDATNPGIEATLEEKNIFASTFTGLTWDKNNPFDTGLKIKNKGATISFLAREGKLVTVTMGKINGVSMSVNGEEAVAMVGASEAKNFYYYSVAEQSFVMTVTSASDKYNMFKAILIEDPYQVTFTNGGTIAPMTFTGTALTLPAATGVGEFQGWFDAAVGGNKIGVAGASYTPAGDVELFAQFLNQSPNNEIASFTYGETTVTATEGKREYAIELPYKSEIPASITVTKAEEHATVSEIAKDGGVFTFSVTAEHGEVANYTVTFTVAPKDGVCIIRATPTSSTAATATGLIGGTAAFKGSNKFKLSNANDYIGVTLAEGTFQAGDIVNIYQNDDVNGTTDLSVFYITLDATASSDKKLVEVANVGKRGNNYFALPAELVDQSTFYVYREDNANCNPTFGYMEVLRPMAPVVTAATILGEGATVNKAAKTVTIEVAFSADITAVTPAFEFVSNDNAQVVVTPAGAQDFTEAKTYRFTDKDGDYTEYVVSITKAEASHDATLSGITVGGIALEGFVAENTSYTYVREYGDDVIPAVEGVKNHAGATVVSTTEGNVVTLTVTAEDNTTEKVYTITFDNEAAPAVEPTFTTDLAATATYEEGGNVTLSVVAERTDEGVLSYQWYKGEELVGENAPSLVVNAEGSYKVVVTNTISETNKATATSTICVVTETLPAGCYNITSNPDAENNYTFADGTILYSATSNGKQNSSSSFRTSANKVSDCGGEEGDYSYSTKNLVFKFEKDIESISLYGTKGSDATITKVTISNKFDFDTKLDVLDQVAFTEDHSRDNSCVMVSADFGEGISCAGKYLYIELSGSADIYRLCYTVAKEQMTAPAVNTTLVDETICAEDNFAMLNAVTAEEATYSYQWFKDEEVIAEATAAFFTPTESGVYYCKVTNHADGYRDNVAETNKVTLVRLTSGTEITDHSSAFVRGEVDAKKELYVTAAGLNIAYEWYTCDAEGNNATIIEGEEEAAYTVTIEAGTKYVKAVVIGTCGAAEQIFTIAEMVVLQQVDVTESTTWDWTKAGNTTDGYQSTEADQVMANIYGIQLVDGFNSQALVMGNAEEYAYRDNSNKCFQGKSLKFHTTVAGKLTINARRAGKSGDCDLTINSKNFGKIDNTQRDYSVNVPAGDVVISVVGEQPVRIYTMTFTTTEDLADTDFNYVRDCGLGAMTTTCLPKNVPAGCFTGATFYETSYFVSGNDGLPYKIYFDEVTELKAGYPYLVVMNEGETTFRVLYGEEEAPAPQHENGFYGVYDSFVDGAKGTASNILEGNYIVYNNEVRLCGGYCGLNNNRAYIIMDGGEKSVRTTDPAPAGTSARRRIALGNPAAAPATTTALDYLTEDGSAHKVMIDSQLYIIRDGKMYNVNGVLVK